MGRLTRRGTRSRRGRSPRRGTPGRRRRRPRTTRAGTPVAGADAPGASVGVACGGAVSVAVGSANWCLGPATPSARALETRASSRCRSGPRAIGAPLVGAPVAPSRGLPLAAPRTRTPRHGAAAASAAPRPRPAVPSAGSARRSGGGPGNACHDSATGPSGPAGRPSANSWFGDVAHGLPVRLRLVGHQVGGQTGGGHVGQPHNGGQPSGGTCTSARQSAHASGGRDPARACAIDGAVDVPGQQARRDAHRRFIHGIAGFDGPETGHPVPTSASPRAIRARWSRDFTVPRGMSRAGRHPHTEPCTSWRDEHRRKSAGMR